MTQYNSSFGGTLPFSDTTYQIALAASTALPITIPGTSANQYRAEFSWPYNANVYVGYNTTAAIPPAGTVAHTDNESIVLRPTVKYVRGGDVLSFISDSIVSNASMELLSLPG